ncbi:hypothetical protein Ae201684P_014245 [Aphanomyces euteiches]|nr:hypothetical protein Ae201684P_014245 [Aphanomyces euteiches]
MLAPRPIVEVALLGAAIAMVWVAMRTKKKQEHVPRKPQRAQTKRVQSDLLDAQLSAVDRDQERQHSRKLLSTTLEKTVCRIFRTTFTTKISRICQWKNHNFDHPDALDTALLVSHLAKLKEGIPCDIPMYDFTTHSRRPETQSMTPKSVILLEGILLFTDPDLVNLMDIKVFVETPSDVRFIRRLRRDIRERGRTAESVIEQYMTTVRPMHLLFVEPSKRVADILVPVGVNAVALELILSRLRSFMTKS